MLNYFHEQSKYDLKVYELKEDQISTFIERLPSLFLNCYASPEKIEKATQSGIARRDVISTYIPDKPNIMSGEFGEILSFHIMKDKYAIFNPYAPLKWRYKESNNTPSHKTDFVLICHDKSSDFIVAAECKAKATQQTDNPIIEAIKGMKKDVLTRLADTLVWLKSKAMQEGNIESVKKLQKLLDPVAYGSYEKKFKAIAIIDKDLFIEPLHTQEDIAGLNFDFELIAIVIPSLKKNYETIFEKILEC